MVMIKKSSRKLSEARGQSKWKKTSVKSRVRNWKLGSQKDERSSFSPATVVSRTSQLKGEEHRSVSALQVVNRTRKCEGATGINEGNMMLCDLWFHLLDSQLLAVTEGEAVVSQRAQHDGGVHHILLKAQKPHVQSLKPHQHSVLCNKKHAFVS